MSIYYATARQIVRQSGEVVARVVEDGALVVGLSYGRPRLIIARIEALRPELLAQIDLRRRQRDGRPLQDQGCEGEAERDPREDR